MSTDPIKTAEQIHKRMVEQIPAREAELMDAIDQQRADPTRPETAAEEPSPPLDLDAERDAYKALIEFINANKDAGTTITHLAVNDFLADLD